MREQKLCSWDVDHESSKPMKRANKGFNPSRRGVVRYDVADRLRDAVDPKNGKLLCRKPLQFTGTAVRPSPVGVSRATMDLAPLVG